MDTSKFDNGTDALNKLIEDGLSRFAARVHRWHVWSARLKKLEDLAEHGDRVRHDPVISPHKMGIATPDLPAYGADALAPPTGIGGEK